MKALTSALMVLLCCSTMGMAQSDLTLHTTENLQTEYLKADTFVPKRIGFKYRHPKMYKNFRKVRAVCIFVGPVVNVAANCFTAVGVFF